MLSRRGASAPPQHGGRSTAATTRFAPSARLRRASAPAGSGASSLLQARVSPSQLQQKIGGTKRRAAPVCPSYRGGASSSSSSSSGGAAASAGAASPTKPSDSVKNALSSPAPSTPPQERVPFSWTAQWYPVAVEADLPKDRPVPIKLLGRRLVLWWGSDSGAGEGEGGSDEGRGRWSCLDDACSHRLAPLSEGRIDASCVPCSSSDSKPCRALACSYHGFSFDASGRAVAVPQARHDGGAEAERRAASSPRAPVRSHPTLALDQLVWVWGGGGGGGGGGDEAAKEAAEAPLPPGPPEEIRRLMLEAAAAAAGKQTGASPPPLVALITNQQYFRDLPVPYDEMMTNLADQSHVPFAHTGVASNRDSPFANHFTVSNVNAHLKEEEEKHDGGGGDEGEEQGTKKARLFRRFPGVAAADLVTFDLEWAPDALALAKQNVTIVPPCYIEYSTPLQSARDLEVAGKSAAAKKIGLRACLWFYSTPLDAGNTRIFNNAVIVAHGLPNWAARLINKRPKWLDHLFLQSVLDGDVAYLPQAAANEKLGLFSNSSGLSSSSSSSSSSPALVDPRGELWARRYFMPANADAAVISWRRWLHGERGRSGWLDAVADNGKGGGGESFSSSSATGSARVGGERFPALSSSSSSSFSNASNVVPLPRSDVPRSELFDRWTQHTKNCPSCSSAMARARGAKKALEVCAAASGMLASSAALLLLLSLSASPSSSSSSSNGGAEVTHVVALVDAAPVLLRVLLSSSALAALSLLGRRAAATLESWFVFKDYEHWKS